jgi:hypothetical protein
MDEEREADGSGFYRFLFLIVLGGAIIVVAASGESPRTIIAAEKLKAAAAEAAAAAAQAYQLVNIDVTTNRSMVSSCLPLMQRLRDRRDLRISVSAKVKSSGARRDPEIVFTATDARNSSSSGSSSSHRDLRIVVGARNSSQIYYSECLDQLRRAMDGSIVDASEITPCGRQSSPPPPPPPAAATIKASTGLPYVREPMVVINGNAYNRAIYENPLALLWLNWEEEEKKKLLRRAEDNRREWMFQEQWFAYRRKKEKRKAWELREKRRQLRREHAALIAAEKLALRRERIADAKTTEELISILYFDQ